MARTVIVHVGAPKTGTSYLQDVLLRNRETLLRDAGILYPAERFDAHFLAALDLMQLPWGGLEQEAIGAWDRLAEEVRRTKAIIRRVAVEGVSFLISPGPQPVPAAHGRHFRVLAGTVHRGRP